MHRHCSLKLAPSGLFPCLLPIRWHCCLVGDASVRIALAQIKPEEIHRENECMPSVTVGTVSLAQVTGWSLVRGEEKGQTLLLLPPV